jgi:hypothetical protein
MQIMRHRHGKRHTQQPIGGADDRAAAISCAHDAGGYRVRLSTAHTFHGPYSETYAVHLTEIELAAVVERLAAFKADRESRLKTSANKAGSL